MAVLGEKGLTGKDVLGVNGFTGVDGGRRADGDGIVCDSNGEDRTSVVFYNEIRLI